MSILAARSHCRVMLQVLDGGSQHHRDACMCTRSCLHVHTALSWLHSRVCVQLFNIISPHLSVLAYLGFSRCYQCIRGAHGARSQRELNLRLLGPEFNLSTRYAQVMNTIACKIHRWRCHMSAIEYVLCCSNDHLQHRNAHLASHRSCSALHDILDR